MEVEILSGPQQRQEFYNIGKEFAFEGLDRDLFKATNLEELEEFNKGYEVGLAMLTVQQQQEEQVEQTSPKMGR